MSSILLCARAGTLTLIIGCLTACAPEPTLYSGSPPAPAATFGVSVAASRVLPTEASPSVPAPTAAPASEPLAGGPACSTTSVTYVLDAVLDWATYTVQVRQRVAYTNDTGHSLDSLVLAVPSVIEPGDFSLNRVALGDQPPLRDYILSASQIIIPLPQSLEPERSTRATLEFSLAIPPIRHGYRLGRTGYLGYSSRQVNLGLWFPQIPPYRDENGWVLHEPWPVGEPFVLRTADYAVILRVENAPKELRVAGPGAMSRPDAASWRFELCGSREISLSLSDQFSLLTTSTASGIPVELFAIAGRGGGSPDAAEYALDTAARAIDLYETRYGSFPCERMVVVEGDFPDGMEFSGLVFVSEAWFRTWGGTANDWLTLITAHEVSHQWWYAAVGSDQGLDPYLDEALATYSELVFLEHYYPDLVDWWWAFRINNYSPKGFVDMPITAFEGPRPYINAVYLQGARMLHDLRRALGDDTFFAWLRRYASTMHGRIAEPADLWRALNPSHYTATEAIRQQYLARADVLRDPDSIP